MKPAALLALTILFLTSACAGPVSTAEPTTEQSAIATQNKIAALTKAPQMTAAMTAIPPTATFPPGSPSCRLGDLKASPGGAAGAGGNIVFGASLKNIGLTPCWLQALPQVILTEQNGTPLDIVYSPSSSAALLTPHAGEPAVIGLLPGQTAGFLLVWGNWCGPAVVGGVVIRLTLANDAGSLNIPAPAIVVSGGSCDRSGGRSFVWVGALEYNRYMDQP